MAIYLVTGKPGSGKTYWAVSHLTRKYYFFDKSFQDWFPKFDVTIISNIENLRLPHVSLDEILHTVSLETFFSVDYQRKLKKKYPKLVYLIDEAQKYFPARYSHKDVDFLWQYHRHLGLDFYFISQDASLISRKIIPLIEYEIHALPRAFHPGRFLYQKRLNGETLSRFLLKKDKKIFSLYSSFQASEQESVSSFSTRYIFFAVFFLLFSVSGFYYFLHHDFFHKKTISNTYSLANDHFFKTPKRQIKPALTSFSSSQQNVPNISSMSRLYLKNFGSDWLIWTSDGRILSRDQFLSMLFSHKVKTFMGHFYLPKSAPQVAKAAAPARERPQARPTARTHTPAKTPPPSPVQETPHQQTQDVVHLYGHIDMTDPRRAYNADLLAIEARPLEDDNLYYDDGLGNQYVGVLKNGKFFWKKIN